MFLQTLAEECVQSRGAVLTTPWKYCYFIRLGRDRSLLAIPFVLAVLLNQIWFTLITWFKIVGKV